MSNSFQKGEFLIRHLRGLEFTPSPEMRKVSGVTWDNDDTHHWYVAFKDSCAIACVGMFLRGTKARFKTDVVVPEYRGQHLYKMLFGMRETLAISLGATEVTTFSNRNSRPMYERSGFVAAGDESELGVLYMRKVFDQRPKMW